MRTSTLRAASAALVAVIASPAQAPVVDISYTEFASSMRNIFGEITEARGLTTDEAGLANELATTWFYIGPCRGDSRRVDDPSSVLLFFSDPKPRRPLDAAFLEMLAVLSLQNLGRHEPSDYVCRFAEETAIAYKPTN